MFSLKNQVLLRENVSVKRAGLRFACKFMYLVVPYVLLFSIFRVKTRTKMCVCVCARTLLACISTVFQYFLRAFHFTRQKCWDTVDMFAIVACFSIVFQHCLCVKSFCFLTSCVHFFSVPALFVFACNATVSQHCLRVKSFRLSHLLRAFLLYSSTACV